MKKSIKKILSIFLIFSIFGGNFFINTNAFENEEIIIIKKKADILYNGIINYKKNLEKIKKNYDLLEDSVLNKNIKKLDDLLVILKNISSGKTNEKDSVLLMKKIIKSFNNIKKENSKYLSNILTKIKNPEILKKVKKEFDFLAYNSKIISYKLDKLIYKFKKFLNKIPSSPKKTKLEKNLKNLYIISLKLKNFRKYIYMGNKEPKKTFSSLLKEIKIELLKLKKNLQN